MRKNRKSFQKNAPSLQKSMSGIRAFREQPDNDRLGKPELLDQKLHASDLFSLFTADIIREQKLFTR